MLGVAKADRLPKDELALVTYITREINPLDKSTTYRVTKQVYHTEESFLGADSCFAHFKPTTPEGVRRELRFKSDKSILWMIWVSLLISAAATSIPVVFISGQWSWSRIMGSFGLFTGLAVSSVMWSHAYIKEQLPTSQNNEDWNDPKNFALVTSASPSRLFVIGNIQAVAEGGLQIYRAVSLFMAAVISLG